MPKKKLYIGCALTNASQGYRNSIEQLKHTLRQQGYEVFDFVGLVAGTATDVYKWDLEHCVGECDIFVGICDFPSIGLGFEIKHALQLCKPTLLVAHKDAVVTRMVLGAAEVEPTIRFERYSDLQTDVAPLIAEL